MIPMNVMQGFLWSAKTCSHGDTEMILCVCVCVCTLQEICVFTQCVCKMIEDGWMQRTKLRINFFSLHVRR